MQPNSEDPNELLWNYIEARKRTGECGEAQHPHILASPEFSSLLALADALQSTLRAEATCETGKQRAEIRLRMAIDASEPPADVDIAPTSAKPGKAPVRSKSLFRILLFVLLFGAAIGFGAWRWHAAAHGAAATGKSQLAPAARKSGNHCPSVAHPIAGTAS